MKKTLITLLLFSAIVTGNTSFSEEETLPPLKNNKAPQTFEEMWAGYDPRKEPLDIEILKEWEEDGVILRVLRYRIGIFKGQKAMMAAVYGFPKGLSRRSDTKADGSKLPGLVQIHGGGQYADYKAPLTNAKRGYATISIAWAGRISAPGYSVNPDIVKLFWDGATNDPNYKITTDWGALDAYHAPCRNEKNAFNAVTPAEWTLDTIESPRNNPWFLCALGARRALTFLEQQPEVDPGKLGVYGHSMGGKLTVATTAADSRVKASAPSCGGLSDRDTDNALYNATIADNVALRHISCPIIFLSPANDFHGRIDDLQKALGEIKSNDWRMTCAAHHNHQDTEQYQVAGPLWFDQYLKGSFRYPRTPDTSLELNLKDGPPLFTVTPDKAKKILGVDIFYTQQGQLEGEKNDRENTIARFWHHADAKPNGKSWTAGLPLLDTDRPLWVYANILYPLDEPVTGAGYYYGVYTAKDFNLSSRMLIVTPEQLKQAGTRTMDKPSVVIETFEKDWEKEWFTYDLTGDWARKTHKLYDPKWRAPESANLALEILSEKPNRMVVGLDNYAAEIQLRGGPEWQSVVLAPADFHDTAGSSISKWDGIRELRLGAKETLRSKVKGQEARLNLGADWQGAKPEFRNMRWIEDKLQKPPQIWSDYDPDKGDFKQEVIKEETKDGIYYRDSYISAYVLGQEIRVYCRYSVKEGAQNAPGLLNVHGWMGVANVDKEYVENGWAVMAHDYCGKTGDRKEYTKYPENLRHGNMDREIGPPIWSETPDKKSITDPKQTSDYLWYAIQRRVLSYLEQQKEVDKTRLGAKGYSYGGTIMWALGTDPRIKAIVAFFGIGYTEYYRNRQVWMYNNPYVEPEKTPGEEIYLAGIAPEAHAPYITAATLWLNGSNDHHGGHERGIESFKKFQKDVPWSFAVQARGHHNTEKIGQDCRMWLEKYVLNKDVFWPQHPTSEIQLDPEGIPKLIVVPASPERVQKVEMYYALKNACSFARSWRDIECVKEGNTWIGRMPVINVDDYVFGYANIIYDTTLILSTDFNAAIPSKLGNAKATDKESSVLYTGDDGIGVWSNVAEVEGPGGIKGFRSTDNNRGSGTEQLSDPKWKAPAGARLGFKFYCTQPQTLIFAVDNHNECEIEITASDKWQEMAINSKQLINHFNQKPMETWNNVGKMHFRPKPGSDITKVVFAEFKWVTP